MKKVTFIATLSLVFMTVVSFAQSNFKQYKAGHVFNVSLPEYMTQTAGLNSAAAIQYKSVVKDVYGIVIYDTKEELRLVDMQFASAEEFYESFIEDFLVDEEKRTVAKPTSHKKGNVKFIETDVTYYDKEAETEIYYLVGVAETAKSYYKVLSWSSAKNKDKFKADFQKILYSIND